MKAMLIDVHKLLVLYLTIPMTTATAEFGISTLRRIKTSLRNLMTQQRLYHCMLLHIHRQKLYELDLSVSAKEIIQRNEFFF